LAQTVLKTDMVRPRPSLGLFGILGRSPRLRALDQAFRSFDVHPRLVPEAVKLTIISLLEDHAISGEPAPQAYSSAAEIVAYCMMGAGAFASEEQPDRLTEIERRIERAVEFSSTLDAKLVLLTLHAKVIQPSVVEQFGLESSSE
jgi:hypothetical protein